VKPSMGQTVLVFTDPEHANGADVAPAVITRVWTDEMVSVRIFHDGPCSPDCTDRATVILYDCRELAEAAPRASWLRPSGAFWPAQEPEPVPAPRERPGPGRRARIVASRS
jgi:hypothetical protein